MVLEGAVAASQVQYSCLLVEVDCFLDLGLNGNISCLHILVSLQPLEPLPLAPGVALVPVVVLPVVDWLVLAALLSRVRHDLQLCPIIITPLAHLINQAREGREGVWA